MAGVVELVLGGPVNRRVVAELRSAGLDAVGLSGVDGGLLVARPAGGGLGMVGEIAHVRAGLLESFLLAGLTPVIAPMAPASAPEGGPPLNVNADAAAGAIAGALHAAELLLLSDVAGVQVDGVLRPTLDAEDVEVLIDSGAVTGGKAAKPPAAPAALHARALSSRINSSHRQISDA